MSLETLTEEEINELEFSVNYCHLETHYRPSEWNGFWQIFLNKYEYKDPSKENKNLKPLKKFFECFKHNIINNPFFSYKENPNSLYFTISDKADFDEKINIFLTRDTILVNDTLDLSICSDYYHHQAEEEKRSELIKLIHAVKMENDETKIEPLNAEIDKIVNDFDFNIYGKDFIVIAVPSSKGIPSYVAQKIAQKMNDKCYIQELNDETSKSQKSCSSCLERLKNINGKISIDLDKDILDGKNILLVDDNYQTGATLNYLGKILKKYYNVNEVYSFCLSKTSSNLN